MEALQLPVLGRAGQAGQVGLIAYGLEVAANEKEGDGRGGGGGSGSLGVQRGDGCVDLVQIAVAAALDGDLKKGKGMEMEKVENSRAAVVYYSPCARACAHRWNYVPARCDRR